MATIAPMGDSKGFENEGIDRFPSAPSDRVPEGLRAERNRQAAAASRERRRAVVNDLEARNRVLSEQNAQAQIEVLTLKREMSELIRHFKAQLERQERERAQLVALIQQQRDRIAQLRKVEEDTAELMGLANVDEIGGKTNVAKTKTKSSKTSS
jgi:response regulator RpfG family c-di-GMP phosphodiesterase